MVDFHSHILPGIDDGSQNVDMSVKMLEMEKSSGIKTIVATPHFYLSDQTLEDFLAERDNAYNQLLPECEKRGVNIHLGAEVLYTHSLADIDMSKLCIGNTKYMMIELPYKQLSHNFIRSFHSFIGSIYPDVVPILAHAERYLNYTVENSIYELLNCDILVQLNSGSFKMFSPHIKFMHDLIKHSSAHLLGTDCHNITSRPPNMEIARKALNKKFPGCYEDMMDNAGKILSGILI